MTSSHAAPLVLVENGRHPVAVSLSAMQARQLTALSLHDDRNNGTGRKVLRVELGGPEGTYNISARDVVGTVSVGGLKVIIKPKCGVKDLSIMIDASEVEAQQDPEASELDEGDFIRHLSRSFLDSFERATEEGLQLGYREARQIGIAPKGNIDFNWTGSGLSLPVRYSYLEFDIDTVENRFYRRVLTRIVDVLGVSDPEGARAYHHRELLDIPDHVGDYYPELTGSETPDYSMCTRIGRSILEAGGVDVETGRHSSLGMLFYMPAVYERFITKIVLDFCRIEGLLGDEQGVSVPRYLDGALKMKLKPDFSIWNRNDMKCILVGDVKYKIRKTGIPRSDVYQMFTYMRILGTGSAVLFYLGDSFRKSEFQFDYEQVGVLTAYSLDVANSSAVCLADRVHEVMANHVRAQL